jgi:hypothetical protein
MLDIEINGQQQSDIGADSTADGQDSIIPSEAPPSMSVSDSLYKETFLCMRY